MLKVRDVNACSESLIRSANVGLGEVNLFLLLSGICVSLCAPQLILESTKFFDRTVDSKTPRGNKHAQRKDKTRVQRLILKC